MRSTTVVLPMVACCASLISLAACAPGQGKSNETPAPVAKAPDSVTCLGRVVPGDGIVKVAAPTSSIVGELRVRRGGVVRKGEVIALLNDYASAVAALKEAEVQISVAQSSVNQAQAPEKPGAIAAQEAAIARQQVVLQNAESDYNRRKQLVDSHLIAAADFEIAELNLNTARESLRRETQLLANLSQVREADVDVARKRLVAAQASRDRAAVDVERQIVRAPMNATVLQIFARPGEAVGADGILDLGDTEHMYVEAEVYAVDIRRVRQGAAATVTGEAFEGALTGKVAEILREAGYNALFPVDVSNAADKRIVRVRIRLDNGEKVQGLAGSQVVVRIQS